MTALQHVRLGTYYVVNLPEPDDFEFWRERARALVQCEVPPDRIAWVEPGGNGDLFAAAPAGESERGMPVPPADARLVRASNAELRTLRTSRRAHVGWGQRLIVLIRRPNFIGG